jgi:hypothetical protein
MFDKVGKNLISIEATLQRRGHCLEAGNLGEGLS